MNLNNINTKSLNINKGALSIYEDFIAAIKSSFLLVRDFARKNEFIGKMTRYFNDKKNCMKHKTKFLFMLSRGVFKLFVN